MRALAWEFPEDQTLRGTYNQYILRPSLLITPVLQPNVEYVKGVFPGIGEGTRWFDWYTLQEVHAKPQENVTLSAPLEHINVHVRGGSILVLQEPGYTTEETKITRILLSLRLISRVKRPAACTWTTVSASNQKQRDLSNFNIAKGFSERRALALIMPHLRWRILRLLASRRCRRA